MLLYEKYAGAQFLTRSTIIGDSQALPFPSIFDILVSGFFKGIENLWVEEPGVTMEGSSLHFTVMDVCALLSSGFSSKSSVLLLLEMCCTTSYLFAAILFLLFN